MFIVDLLEIIIIWVVEIFNIIFFPVILFVNVTLDILVELCI